MRQLMEDGLKWEHGVQFICLAFQNATAAQMNGYTIHHWSGIPARNESGSSEGARHQLSVKCQALRVIIIDEVSMVSAELLGALQYVVTKAVRLRGTYKNVVMVIFVLLLASTSLCVVTFGSYIQYQEIF